MIFQWRINRQTTGASPGCRQPSHPIGIVSKNVEKKKLQPQLDLLTIRPRTRLPCFKHRSLEEQPEATATKNGVSQLTGFTSSFAKDLERSAKNGPSSIKPNPIPKQKGARSCSQDREVPEIEDPRKTSGCRRASEEKTRISKET